MSPRLDAMLVARGLARSRGEAGELVAGRLVRVNGVVAGKAASAVSDDDDIVVTRTRPPRVSRAADKLDEAFAAFGATEPEPLLAAGRRCVDVGASTGGFTQVLLERGATSVVAIDVGHGQLAPALATDPRVTNLEGRHIRDVDPAALGGPADLLVADLSFISLVAVLDRIAPLVVPGGQAVLLVKPQFEVGRTRLGKNGLVRDPSERVRAILGVTEEARRVGLYPRGIIPSPVRGSTGNREYLVWTSTRHELALPGDHDAAWAAVRTDEGRR